MDLKLDRIINKHNIFFYVLSLINIGILSYLIWKEAKIIIIIFQVFISSIGGILAAILTFRLDSKGKMQNKRLDKYADHRNTLVQIEHELAPTRVSVGNNIKALEDAVQQFDSGVPRLILRMYKSDFSTGLSLRLINLELINDYSKIYILLKKINSDIDYLNQIVEKIQLWLEQEKDFSSLLVAYEKLIRYLVIQCKKADKKILDIVAKCKIALSLDEQEEKIKNKYRKDGKEVIYSFPKNSLDSKKADIVQQEKRPYIDGENPDQTFMLYLDLKLVIKQRRTAA